MNTDSHVIMKYKRTSDIFCQIKISIAKFIYRHQVSLGTRFTNEESIDYIKKQLRMKSQISLAKMSFVHRPKYQCKNEHTDRSTAINR